MKWILIILMLPAAGCTAIKQSFDPFRDRGFAGNIDYQWSKHDSERYALGQRIEWLDKVGHSQAWGYSMRHEENLRYGMRSASAVSESPKRSRKRPPRWCPPRRKR
jgi:hypothetical protein